MASSLAVIFSGSQNNGNFFCNDRQNPFFVRRESSAKERANAVPRVSWKENFEAFFPTLADLERNQEIPTYLFTRGFLKKTGKSATPRTSSSKSATRHFLILFHRRQCNHMRKALAVMTYSTISHRQLRTLTVLHR